MSVDWGYALQIGATGFGLVFGFFIVLALVVKLMGWAFARIRSAKTGTSGSKKTA